MRKLLMLIAMTLTMSLSAWAQSKLTGKIIEDDSKEPLAATTVRLLHTDSTMVQGRLTETDGTFTLQVPKDGKYILKVTSVGFKTLTKNITVAGGKDQNLGTMAMKVDAIMLNGATITKQMAKVTLKEDTFVYNAGAYRTPEGSVVEELVKRLPGAQVSDDGKITINGKEVKKILVDGKEFMTGDTKTAMKNLPTSIVEKVKAYDEKSDLARVSGIDDGEEQTVLDCGIKKGMNKGFLTNNDVAIGTEDRYAARLMAAQFDSKLRLMAMVNANNVGDRGFGGGGGRFGGGGGRNGLNASKMAGLNFNYEEKGLIKLDGSVRWNHSDGDAWSRTASENFVSTTGSFSNSISQNYSRSNGWDAQMRVEWTPDTMTTITFRPTLRISSNDGLSMGRSATFNTDPYDYTDDPLDEEAILLMSRDSMAVNSGVRRSLSYSDSKNFGGSLQFNRKLSSTGRNLTLQLRANYSEGDSKSLSTNNVELFLKDSLYQTNRYNLTPQKNYNYSARVTYSEPIFKATYLQLSYQFQYKYTKSDRSTYDFSNLGEDFFDGVGHVYRGWDDYISRLESGTGFPLDTYYDDELSKFSQYKNYIHDIQLMLRIVRKSFNLHAGISIMPQQTKFSYRYLTTDTVTTRNVTNISPTLNFRWKISKVTQLRINYRGSSSQPSMTQLLPITDNSNPLNITMGNPGLKPAFTSRLWANFNTYAQEKQRFFSTFLMFSTTSNSISNQVTYDAVTGGRTTKPVNIDGNWNISGNMMFNMPLDSAGYFSVNSTSEVRYDHGVGFVTLNKQSSSVKNTTNNYTFTERLGLSYRNEWLEVEPAGSVTYNHAKNLLQPTANLDTWQFSYGFNTTIQLPWGTALATDLNMSSRRGYSDNSLNTNELIWNAQLSQSFLKKQLTISLQLYDLLHQQSSFSRSISASQRTDTEYNAITSYAMLHVIYRMNLIGGKDARNQMRQGPGEGPGGPEGSEGGRGNRNRGGSRSGGFGGGGFGGPRF